jgi:hypothetical protein
MLGVDDLRYLIRCRRDRPFNAVHLVRLGVKLQRQKNQRVLLRRLKGLTDGGRYDIWVAKNLGRLYYANLVSLWIQRNGITLIPLPFLEDETEDDRVDGECLCSQVIFESRRFLTGR